MIAAFWAVYWRELVLFKRRARKLAATASVGPLLYLVTFGYALGGEITVGGRDYLEFLVPGLVAMAGMTQGFGMASEINVARFYSGVFEVVQASPAGPVAYACGEVAAGLTRVLFGTGVILVLGFLFGVSIHCGVQFWLAVILNGFAFSAMAVGLAMTIRSHADQGMLTAFVITPMAFLGGTFFPLDRVPEWLRSLLSLLPLSHAAAAIRTASYGEPVAALPYGILAGCCVLFFLFAVRMVAAATD